MGLTWSTIFVRILSVRKNLLWLRVSIAGLLRDVEQ